MNKTLAIRAQLLFVLALIVGALPFYPKKKKITTKKALKILQKSGQVKEDFAATTHFGENYRICLCNSQISSTYFVVMQIVFVVLLVVSMKEQLTRMGLERVSDNYTDAMIWAAYLASVGTATCMIRNRRELQHLVDFWLLFPTVQLQSQRTVAETGEVYLAEPNNHKNKGNRWGYSRRLFQWLLFGYFIAIISLIPTFMAGSPTSAAVTLIMEFRAEQNVVLYMALASAIGDRAKAFNSALKEALEVGLPETTLKMKFYYLMTRSVEKDGAMPENFLYWKIQHWSNNLALQPRGKEEWDTRIQENYAQDLMKFSLIFCHLKRMIVVIFSFTSLILWVRNEDVAFESVIQYLPTVSYNIVAMIHFYTQGEKIKGEVDEPKTILQCSKPPNKQTVDQAEKFYMATMESFTFTAGKITEFSIQGLWQDAQFQFTVVTVMVQLYESS